MLVFGAAGFMTAQSLPFQPSINGASAASLPVKAAPVATQKLAVAHDTPSRKPPWVPAGAEILPGVQVRPFQDSVSSVPMPCAEPATPTATQLFGDRQDTALRWLPAGAGGSMGVHAVPFQVSASASPVLPLSRTPTTTQ